MARATATPRSRSALLAGPKNPGGLYYRAATEALKRLAEASHLEISTDWTNRETPVDLILGTSSGSFTKAIHAVGEAVPQRILFAFSHGGFLARSERILAKHRRAYELATRIICQTPTQAGIIRQEWPTLTNIRVSPLIVARDLRAEVTESERTLATRALWLDPERPIYPVAIDWEEPQQIEVALALSRLRPNCQFILFGNNPKAHRNALNFQTELPLENVRAQGELRVELVAPLCWVSRALIVLDTNLSHPFFLEDAIASHLPIISVKLSLLAELMGPGRDYLQVSSEADRIAQALESPELDEVSQTALKHLDQLHETFDPAHYLD